MVDEASATLGIAGERKILIDADHLNLCKFKNSEHNLLPLITSFIGEFCDVVPEADPLLRSTNFPPTDYKRDTNLSLQSDSSGQTVEECAHIFSVWFEYLYLCFCRIPILCKG